MTALALVVALLAAAPHGRIYNRNCDVQSRRSSRGGIDCGHAPLFEFASTTGVGMGAVCACAAISGSKGEPITVTRASSAYCTKANETSGIANGDLVLCGANLPLVMPGGDGSGPLGVLVEQDSTNSVLRSQEFENAAWTLSNTLTSDPVVTANAATAPDGTATAERIQFPATSAVQDSLISQSGPCTGVGASNPNNGSVYIKGVSGSGSLDLCIKTNTVAAWTCVTCAYASTGWSRCLNEKVVITASSAWMLGQGSIENGGTARGANDVYAWGAQCERSASSSTVVATSYIPTTSAAVARVGAVVTAPVLLPGGARSVALTYVTGAAPVTSASLLSASAANSINDVTFIGTNAAIPSALVGTFRVNSSSSTVTSTATLPASASTRLSASYDGTNKQVCVDGVCNTTAAALVPFATATQVNIGARVATTSFVSNRVVKLICVDNTPGGCR